MINVLALISTQGFKEKCHRGKVVRLNGKSRLLHSIVNQIFPNSYQDLRTALAYIGKLRHARFLYIQLNTKLEGR